MSYFQKSFLHPLARLGLFTKIKKGSRTSFWCKFSAYFFHKNVSYLILYQLIEDRRKKRARRKHKNLKFLRMK